ncbi:MULTISPECIES: hypothetical protein [unclassified Rickettsia]|uniref:hypothetical protein n=1 Tax=unclassified Rickettsia TaxID=114295 RepID=UPI003132EC6B
MTVIFLDFRLRGNDIENSSHATMLAMTIPVAIQQRQNTQNIAIISVILSKYRQE